MPFINTSELKVGEPLPGWQGRFFRSDNVGFASYTIVAGASIHEHSHPNEEIWHVIEGELSVTVDGETRVAGPGVAAVVPSNVPHSVRAVTAARALVVSYPIRHEVGGYKIT